MLRYLSLICVVLLSACNRNGGPMGVADMPKRDFITCIDKVGDSPQPVGQGGKILLESQQAYAAIRSYAGTIRSTDVARYDRGSFRETLEMKVFFQRPGKIRLEAFGSNDLEFTILCDGQTTQVSSSLPGEERTRKRVQDAMLDYSAASLLSTLMLPGILLETEWERGTFCLPYGPFLPAFASRAELTGEQMVGQHLCNRIVCRREVATWTFFVDKETLLIHRLDEDTSEEQMRFQRELGGGGFSGRILSTHQSQEFEIETINANADEALFTRP